MIRFTGIGADMSAEDDDNVNDSKRSDNDVLGYRGSAGRALGPHRQAAWRACG
jgi:hypothetical protein